MKIVLRDARPVQLESCQCSCVAGTALCHHVAALLYQTAHYCQLSITSVPQHSCTAWLKPRTMGVKPGLVNNMVILSVRLKEGNLVKGVSNMYKGVSSPLPSIFRVDEVYHDLPSNVAPLITTAMDNHAVFQ